MRYKVTKNGEVVKKNLSKKQAEDYCEKMNKEFMDSQEKIQKGKVKSGLPLRKSKYELYKVEVVKENIVRLNESDLLRLVKKVINEQGMFGGPSKAEIVAKKVIPDLRVIGDRVYIGEKFVFSSSSEKCVESFLFGIAIGKSHK